MWTLTNARLNKLSVFRWVKEWPQESRHTDSTRWIANQSGQFAWCSEFLDYLAVKKRIAVTGGEGVTTHEPPQQWVIPLSLLLSLWTMTASNCCRVSTVEQWSILGLTWPFQMELDTGNLKPFDWESSCETLMPSSNHHPIPQKQQRKRELIHTMHTNSKQA